MRNPDFRADHGRLSMSLFAMLGLRPPAAEHSHVEGALLRRFAEQAETVVEIGVAEGGGAWEMRQVISPHGTLFLIDPYPHGRLGSLRPVRTVARRLVGSVARGTVVWIEERSQLVGASWTRPIDFLFIDGDHTLQGVTADWDAWNPHIAAEGYVALHDARMECGWLNLDDGPVQLLAQLRRDEAWEIVAEADSLVVLRRRVG